jgi:lipopolysaccharide transport system permease protein
VIDAEAPRTRVELSELWRARELGLHLAWRDVKVRYKQSLIGIGWAVVQPVLTMIVFTLIFGKFASFPSQGLPYPVFVFVGLVPWFFFSSALTQIGSCVQVNRQLLKKVYFPRLILPISGLFVPAVDFVFSFAVLLGIMFWYDVGIEPTALLAPLFLLLLAVTALGVGGVLATINARYRDVPYAIPFLIQTWLWVSPVTYPLTGIPEKWQTILALNPVVASISGFRWALTGTPAPSTTTLVLGVGMALVFLFVGFRVFRSGETRFADTV